MNFDDSDAGAASGLKIYVLEDHADTLRLLLIYLNEDGHSAVGAKSLEEARRDMVGADFQVLLSDIELPDGKGWELVSDPNFPSGVYCISMSGTSRSEDVERTKANGFRKHLRKPLNPDEVNEALSEASEACFGRSEGLGSPSY